ncbi:MAG TPA: hypothetical protein VI278_07965 [Nitrososphaeraceae archaeon]
MNTKKTTATLTIFVIVTAVALVTANGLNTQGVCAERGYREDHKQ